MKTILAVMASLMAAVVVHASVPTMTVLHNETPPGQRITLQNGVVTQLVALSGVDAGTWLVWGACTVQDRVMQGVPGYYLYTYSAVSQTPSQMPGGGLQSLDARPYNTGYLDENGRWHQNLYWWFAADPPSRVFHFTGDPTLYLIVQSYGQVAPSLSQAFGSIVALKVGD